MTDLSAALTAAESRHCIGLFLDAVDRHDCLGDWCGERIDVGTTYKRYRWFQHGHAGTCRMHKECHGAMELAADEEGGWIEFLPGDNERPHAQPNDKLSRAGTASA